MPPRGGYDYIVLDWTPDGDKILVRANRTPYGRRVGRYFLVDPGNGGLEEPLQIPEGGPASFSPDGLSIAIASTRVRGERERYDLFVVDLNGRNRVRLTDGEGSDRFPDWRPPVAGE